MITSNGGRVDGAFLSAFRGTVQAKPHTAVYKMHKYFARRPWNVFNELNLSFSFLKENQVEIITGVNLPMLIKFVSLQRSNALKDAAKKVVDQGKKNIHLVSVLLSSRTK